METLQIRAATLIYQDVTNTELTDIYSAVDKVANLPPTAYLRTVRFKLLTLPVNAKTYTYLIQWLDATPPRLLSLERFDRHIADEAELQALDAGEVVVFRPERVEETWVLDS